MKEKEHKIFIVYFKEIFKKIYFYSQCTLYIIEAKRCFAINKTKQRVPPPPLSLVTVPILQLLCMAKIIAGLSIQPAGKQVHVINK